MLHETSVMEKGGGSFAGIKLLLCENPLPPIDAAVEAAARELLRSNFYTKQYSQPLREAIGRYCQLDPRYVHVNAGSEVILRQIVARFGRKTHLIIPTFALFEEIAAEKSHTFLKESQGFQLNMSDLEIPEGTTLTIIVNPNGSVLDLRDNLALLERHPNTMFLVDEAFIEFGGRPVADLVPHYPNLLVTRTFSKAFSLAGLRVGYAVAPKGIVDWLISSNNAYPLARPSQAAAIACLENMGTIMERASLLKGWGRDLCGSLKELGVQTFPTETYFFLGKMPRMSGKSFAQELRRRDILVKALHPPGLGENYSDLPPPPPRITP